MGLLIAAVTALMLVLNGCPWWLSILLALGTVGLAKIHHEQAMQRKGGAS